MKGNIGIIGLGVMGLNLALNIERHGFTVSVYDSNVNMQQDAIQKSFRKNIYVASDLNNFCGSLELPKKIMMMIPAGGAVDQLICDLNLHMNTEDILIDGGNTHYLDTERRRKELKEKGIQYIGAGFSGGQAGALWGPSIMPGGDEEAWQQIKPIFNAIAAKTDDGAVCCEWVGSGGSGHFVKMVHNGIEYAEMQLICEAYALMERALAMHPKDISKVFKEWGESQLNGYLIEITSEILAKNDEETGKPIIDLILDTADQKGSGKWAINTALDLGVPCPTIAEAVFARSISSLKEERVNAAQLLNGPSVRFNGDKKAFLAKIQKALYASKICIFAQGFQLIAAASDAYDWDLNFCNIALLWRSGCIIRAEFLDDIKNAFVKDGKLPNILLDDSFAKAIAQNQPAWRAVVSTAIELGIPVQAFGSALTYYDCYRCERLPANLLQAQRDFFGAHKYERIDKPRGQLFHTRWVDDS